MSIHTKLFVILCSIFCVTVISGNLIFQKFVSISIFEYNFNVSVGILFYPVTFLISDIVTEFYGESHAKLMVKTAILCSIFILVIVYISSKLSATPWSKINNNSFDEMFSVYGVGALSSLFANYLGQLTDIKIYAYLKKCTSGKYLWLRNNISTIMGQLIDTLVIISLLSLLQIIPFEQYIAIAISSLSFKIIAAIIDTPFLYLIYYIFNKL